MDKRTKYILITIIAMLVIIITGTFAWLTYQSKKTAMVLTIGDLKNMQISLTPYQIDAELDPELVYTDVVYSEITAVNNETEAMNYQLYYDIEEIDNSLISNDFKYTIERSTNGGTTSKEYESGNFSTANTTDNFIILDEDVPANTTYKYRVYVWVDGGTNPNTGIEGATFKAELRAEIIGYARAYITESITGNKAFYKEDTYREKIVSVSFVNYINIPNNAVATYDLKTRSNHPITAWLVPGQETNTYDLYIGANNEKIYAKPMNFMFMKMTALASINFSNLDTSEVTGMAGTFTGCKSLTSLDLSSFDTSNVTSMNGMFTACSGLTTIDVSNFNTSNVTSMTKMFYGYLANISSSMSLVNIIGLENFDTSKVTSMQGMFSYCTDLINFDISNFNTSNVINMDSMFVHCDSLTELDLRNFDTRSVKDMDTMFYDCDNLVNIDLSSFDTSNVTSMQYMFSYVDNNDSKLEHIYVSNTWNMASVTNSIHMFDNCIHLPNFNSSVVDKTNAHYNTGGYLTYKAYTPPSS